MIPLHRRRVTLPAQLIQEANGQTHSLVRLPDDRSRRKRFHASVWNLFRQPLARLSNHKCAYCESIFESESQFSVHHFRPIGSVAENPRHPGYYWLAYDWDNLLPLCESCDRNKRNHFPLDREELRVTRAGGRLKDESPLILDPADPAFRPRRHFAVDAQTGEYRPLTAQGEITIDILGLNRASLIERRRVLAKRVLVILRQRYTRKTIGVQRAAFHRQLLSHMKSTAPFAGFAQLLVKSWFNDRSIASASGLRIREKQPLMKPARVEKAVAVIPELSRGLETSGYIEKIEIYNFKCIPRLKLEFSKPREGSIGWQVFLGENGSGKSSVLQAVALALAGRKNVESAGIVAKEVLANGRGERGRIKLWMSRWSKPITLNFSPTGFRFNRNYDGANFFVRGYGATRLLAREADIAQEPQGDERRVIKNLFDPHTALTNASAWLAAQSENDFEKIALTLRDLLRIDQSDNLVITRNNGRVVAVPPTGSEVSLHMLSYGQQAALALAVDLMAGIMRDRIAAGLPAAPGDFREAAGIVLLDEIDAHLHPRWKMRIVASLRSAFRALQFIVTTHEPLCLRGLRSGEIVVMRHEAGKLDYGVSPISPEGLRVDQLLTSPLFGLSTTIDPDVEVRFRRYYELLAKKDCTEAEISERDSLAAAVQSQNRLGYTRRDQLLYEVIDRCLAEEGTYGLARQNAVHEKTKAKVMTLWRGMTKFA